MVFIIQHFLKGTPSSGTGLQTSRSVNFMSVDEGSVKVLGSNPPVHTTGFNLPWRRHGGVSHKKISALFGALFSCLFQFIISPMVLSQEGDSRKQQKKTP